VLISFSFFWVIWARLAREAPRRRGEDVDGLVVIGVSRECPGPGNLPLR